MPVSDADHQEVLVRLGAQDRTLNRIEGRAIEANTRISKLELAQAITKDRQEQAAIREARHANASLSTRTVVIGIATLIATYGGILATIVTTH